MLKLGLEFAPTLPQTDNGGGNEDDPALCGRAVFRNFLSFSTFMQRYTSFKSGSQSFPGVTRLASLNEGGLLFYLISSKRFTIWCLVICCSILLTHYEGLIDVGMIVGARDDSRHCFNSSRVDSLKLKYSDGNILRM